MGISKCLCVECEAYIPLLDDVDVGEIISCPDCGMDYVIETDENGVIQLTELNLEGEDWGE